MPQRTSIERSTSSANSAPPTPDDEATDESPWWLTGLTGGAVAVVAFSATRAIVRGYVPIDDNAVVETRARDVLSARIPLLGSVSSASQTGPAGVVDRGPLHHPGPLLYDLLALPVRVLPDGAGVALGAAGINIAAVIAVAWCARRALGAAGACIVMVAAVVLMWSFGSESLFEVWQPIVTLLPLLVLLVASWGWAAGDDALAVPAVLAGSFVVQTHGSYVLLGPAVLALAAGCRLANRRESPTRRRALLVAAGLGVVVWLQPIVDQLFGSHNISAIIDRASSAGERSLGLADAVRAAAMVLVRPPWWTRGGVDTALPNGGGFVNDERGRVFEPDWMPLPLAIGGLVFIVTVLVAVAVLGRRRGDPVLTGGAVIGVGALVVAIATLTRLPIDAFGFTAHKVRWLWPIGAFLSAFGAVALVRLGVPASRRQATLSVVLVGAVALVATLPTATLLVSPAQYEAGSADVARDLRDALGPLEDRGVVFLDLSGRAFPDPYNDTVAAEMTARGIPFRVEGAYLVGQYGDRRRLDEAVGVDATVRVFTGAAADSIPSSWDVVVRLSDGELPVVLAISEGLVRTADAPSG